MWFTLTKNKPRLRPISAKTIKRPRSIPTKATPRPIPTEHLKSLTCIPTEIKTRPSSTPIKTKTRPRPLPTETKKRPRPILTNTHTNQNPRQNQHIMITPQFWDLVSRPISGYSDLKSSLHLETSVVIGPVVIGHIEKWTKNMDFQIYWN